MRNLQLYLKYDLIYVNLYRVLNAYGYMKWSILLWVLVGRCCEKVEREFELIIFLTGLETEAHGKQAKWAAGGAAWLALILILLWFLSIFI